jgi:hypothetical protein
MAIQYRAELIVNLILRTADTYSSVVCIGQAPAGLALFARRPSDITNSLWMLSIGSTCRERGEMMDPSTIIWGIIFGSIGMGFFIYGKKQQVFIPIASGIGLMIIPYFVANIYILILIGLVLIALPYFLRA